MLPNPGAAVYGTIMVGVLLAAEAADRESYADTVGAVVIALLLFWLAHAYSRLAEQRLQRNQPLTPAGAARVLAEELMIIAGAAVPLLVELICWALGVRLTSAVTAALWTAAAMIVIIEVLAAVRADLTGWALVVQTAVGALFGLLVIALHLVLD